MHQKVFVVVDDLFSGGAEKQCLLLVKGLKVDWRPIIVSFYDGPVAEQYRAAGIDVFFISKIHRFDFISPLLKILWLIIKYKPVLFHSWGWMSAILTSFYSSVLKIPHVNSTIRVGIIPSDTKYRRRFAANKGTFSVANSYAGLRSWKVPEKKGVVIHNGFDLSMLPSLPSRSKRSDQPFRVIMTATMSKRKDWNAFVNVAARTIEQDNDTVFLGFGTGVNRDKILRKASETIHSSNIFFPGYTSDPVSECLKSDLGILLSTAGEGISNSIMEYMVSGLPVICSDEGGNSELVVDGVTGFLVDPKNDTEEITEKILWLKNNPDKATAMGRAGRARIISEFSDEKMIKQYNALYHKALNSVYRYQTKSPKTGNHES